MSRHCRKLGS
uniref:Uncharacterized protein n=1 Tax=Arundo donax TaxID=35708 RepID=A0A0A8ZSZ5_ARUDO